MSWVHKTDFTIDEGKGRLNPSREKKACVTFLLCDPDWCVHILTERCSPTSRINRLATSKHFFPP